MKIGMLIEKVRMHVSIWWVDLGVESQQNRRWYRQRGSPRIIGADWSRDKLSQAQCPAKRLGTWDYIDMYQCTYYLVSTQFIHAKRNHFNQDMWRGARLNLGRVLDITELLTSNSIGSNHKKNLGNNQNYFLFTLKTWCTHISRHRCLETYLHGFSLGSTYFIFWFS